MSSVATSPDAAGVGTVPARVKPSAVFTRWELWGTLMVLPYLLVFLVFVLYPVGYGLWLARHPQSYVKLVEDPIFFRSLINTVVFLVIAINVIPKRRV